RTAAPARADAVLARIGRVGGFHAGAGLLRTPAAVRGPHPLSAVQYESGPNISRRADLVLDRAARHDPRLRPGHLRRHARRRGRDPAPIAVWRARPAVVVDRSRVQSAWRI